LSAFHLFAALVSFAALAAYANHRLARLPASIALMLSALAFSLAALALERGGLFRADDLQRLVSSIDFGDLVLHGLLAFLLFAGALHVDLARLRNEAWTVGLLATLGVAISAAVMGLAFWGVARALGLDLPLAFALLFGVLIAPTDPIAVLAILRQAGAPPALEMQITGESLFNDGVAVVLFISLLGFATAGGAPAATDVLLFFVREVGGALLLGGAVGFVAYRLLHGIDEYPVELLITLAAAMGGYSAAEALEVSAPITVVVAGLLIGNPGRAHAMSERTRQHVDSFWELVDYVVNAVLFVLLGLEVVLLAGDLASGASAWLIAAAVPLSVAARFAGVALPIGFLRMRRSFGRGTVAMLTWGGLKGGISLALALSLPEFAGRELVLGATYAVVVFSLLAQGLTVGRLARAVCRANA
jgi:CPA1 family monovalent cation:H+ antiporter